MDALRAGCGAVGLRTRRMVRSRKMVLAMNETGYSEIVMEHFAAPRNFGALAEADGVGRVCFQGRAPCVSVYVRLDDSRIAAVSFESAGCGATIAAGSMLTELVQGRTIDESLAISVESLIAALGGIPTYKRFCAALALDALCAALTDAQRRREEVA